MLGGGGREEGGGRRPAEAVVAGLAALFAAALAAGVFDGAPPERPRRQAVADGRLAAAPVPHLCFRGPGGEPVDFPAAPQQKCPQADAAGLRLASARP